MTYECTVVGTLYGTTVWRGSAFNCISGEISLIHSLYTESAHRRARGQCNNGSIIAQSLGINDGCYISQLSVTVGADVIGKTIECVHDSGGITTVVGSRNITNTCES